MNDEEKKELEMKLSRGYDVSERLSLSGMQGMLVDDEYTICLGQSVVVGRSRKCEVSTRRSRPNCATRPKAICPFGPVSTNSTSVGRLVNRLAHGCF